MESATGTRREGKRKSYHHSWWGKAANASLVGWIFAAIVAALMVLLYAMNFAPAKSLERFGIDLGMRLYSNTTTESKSYQYVFVDVDEEACKQFLDNKIKHDAECRTSKPVPPSLIIDFVRAARESQAALVIVDVSPPEKNEKDDHDALARELTKNSDSSNTWIIAPLYGRPGESLNRLVINGDSNFDIVPNHSQGKLRLASAATYAENGVVRVYPTASCFVTDKGQRWVPTIPYLAAMLMSPATAISANQLYYGNKMGTNAYVTVTEKQDCSLLRIPPIKQFFYSLPVLGTHEDTQDRKSTELKHDAYYQRYKASKLIDHSCSHLQTIGSSTSPGCFAVREELYKDKIIVLGSSRAQAMDRIQTPIGPMSGSELILNATRAFLEFKPLEQPPPLTMLWDKLVGITIATGPMVIAWGLIFACWPVTRWIRWHLLLKSRQSKWLMLRRCRWHALDFFRSIVVVMIFAMGIIIAYLLEVKLLFHQLQQGVAVDLLFPAVALALEGFAEGAKVILSILHRVPEIVIGYLLALLTRFYR
jgi:hypothetical protein